MPKSGFGICGMGPSRLMTTAPTPPTAESNPSSTREWLFPHLADGGGCTTQFTALQRNCRPILIWNPAFLRSERSVIDPDGVLTTCSSSIPPASKREMDKWPLRSDICHCHWPILNCHNPLPNCTPSAAPRFSAAIPMAYGQRSEAAIHPGAPNPVRSHIRGSASMAPSGMESTSLCNSSRVGIPVSSP